MRSTAIKESASGKVGTGFPMRSTAIKESASGKVGTGFSDDKKPDNLRGH